MTAPKPPLLSRDVPAFVGRPFAPLRVDLRQLQSVPGEPSGGTVFFTLNESRARSIAAGPAYDGRVIAVSIPPDFLDRCDGPNDFDDNEDVEVPIDLLPILNTFPRRQA